MVGVAVGARALARGGALAGVARESALVGVPTMALTSWTDLVCVMLGHQWEPFDDDPLVTTRCQRCGMRREEGDAPRTTDR